MVYSALRDLVNACQAHSRGLTVLPNFREPVLDQGDTGTISLQKSLSQRCISLDCEHQGQQVTDSALGTGVIIDPAGYVLTNWHVIEGYDGAIVFF